MISPLWARPQNTSLSWNTLDEVFDTCVAAVPADTATAAAKLPSPSVDAASYAAFQLARKAGGDMSCGDVHIAADSKEEADELVLTAIMSTTGFDGICRPW